MFIFGLRLILLFGLSLGQRPRTLSNKLKYVGVSSVETLSWNRAANRCRRLEMELCLRKDLCLLQEETYVPQRLVKTSRKQKYVPVADEYNDWLYLGPRVPKRCKKITETDGPRLSDPQFCSESRSKKISAFCASESGFYCCEKNEEREIRTPKPVPVYVHTRINDEEVFYSFSLTDNTKNSAGSGMSGDLSKFYLSPSFEKGKFENPVFFCTLAINEKILHLVSDTWCPFGWNLNFYLYGSAEQSVDMKFQKLVIGTRGLGKEKHSRISFEENDKFPAHLIIYAPPGALANQKQPASNVESDCSADAKVLSTQSGTISFSSFLLKSNRGKNFTCAWKISAPKGSVVRIEFQAMRLKTTGNYTQQASNNENFLVRLPNRGAFDRKCSGDRVDISGYGVFCGKKLPPSFVTVDNDIAVTFYGTSTGSGNGFSLSFDVIGPPHGLTLTKMHAETFRRIDWENGKDMCEKKGQFLCNSVDICSIENRPFYGVQEGDQWTPIADEYNDWLQIGRGNVPTCGRHNIAFGPPQWGLPGEPCQQFDNVTIPCPRREYLYCCGLAAQKEPFSQELITVLIYSAVQNGVVFSKYLREGIDQSTSFDNLNIWTPRKKRGDFSSIHLFKERSLGNNKVVYFCQREVVPAIGRVKYAYTMLLQPCTSKGWKYLYHLYAMSSKMPGALEYHVGIYEKAPHHSRLHAKIFPDGFQSDSSYILYAHGPGHTDEELKNNTDMPSETTCNGHVSVIQPPSIIESPGYPKSYENGANCKWLINLPDSEKAEGSKLKITIRELNLEDPGDVLYIYEVADVTNPENNGTLVRQFTGMVGNIIVETEESFFLDFRTDDSISRKGFRLQTEIVTKRCGGDVRRSNDIISSPNYPSLYPTDATCEWSILAPSDSYNIELNFVNFDLRSGADCPDSLLIFDGSKSIQFCGDSPPVDKLSLNSSQASVTFKTSAKIMKTGKGFKVNVNFVENQEMARPQCGVQSVPFEWMGQASDKILGGNVATEGNFPWYVHVDTQNSFCGGTLISKRHVLSAVHCLISAQIGPFALFTGDPAEMKFIVGRHTLNVPSPGEQILSMEAFVFPQNYSKYAVATNRNGVLVWSEFSYNDVILIHLASDVRFTPMIQPICLPSIDAHVGDTCYIAGMGSLDVESKQFPGSLQYAKAPILDSSLCNSFKPMKGTVFENAICAGYPEGGPGMCFGDSGTALVCRGQYGNFYINGIASWSVGCGGKKAPGVYVRVANFYDWIIEAMKDLVDEFGEGTNADAGDDRANAENESVD